MDPNAGYWKRVMRLHFSSINDDRPSRAKTYWDAAVYGSVMLFLLLLLDVFGDLK
jgi:hypothetical protein